MVLRPRSFIRRLFDRLRKRPDIALANDADERSLVDADDRAQAEAIAEELAPDDGRESSAADAEDPYGSSALAPQAHPAPPTRPHFSEPPRPSAAESALCELLEEVREGRSDPSSSPTRVLDLLGQFPDDAEHRALQLLLSAAELLPRAAALRYELARRHYHRRDLRSALPLLRELTEDPGHAAHAHFLLGDHYRSEADLHAALSHYEAVLGLEFTYPGARARADDLRRRLDRPMGASAPTLLGSAEMGPGSRFLLQREIGRGGGGTVYLAHDRSLGRPVAVKVLHPHVARRAEARAHLFCEARIAAALRHPRIVTIYDLDEQLNLVAMEYCAGGTLGDRIDRGALSTVQALEQLGHVTSLLETVHAYGVVHRDLKPANLLFRRATDDALPVLSDFGIAHAPLAEDADPAEVVGSRAYMAPEQRLGEPPDPRADLYSCGMLLVEMLLGRRALSDQQALRGALPADLSDLWQELEDATPLAARPAIDLARRLLDPQPHRRPATASEVSQRAAALSRACRRLEQGQLVLDSLEQRAGPPPRPEPVERWLAAQRDALLGG